MATNALPPVGKITAVFHEKVKGQGKVEVLDNVDKTSILPSSFDDATESFSAMGAPKGKKAFANEAGSTVSGAVDSKPRSTSSPRFQQRYEKGRRLGEITIHYASTLGFIHLGILSNPSQQSTPGSNNDGMAAAAEPARSAMASNSSFAVATSHMNESNQDHNDGESDRKKKRIKTERTTNSVNNKNATVDLTAEDSD